ncbi:zinc finger and SCAN domain-containing protein 31-like [Ctenocephalides felis]|uniref:zinc finger and SCAN domain-containing protein 31-like n=1 Tax=Ctenocephalides felis TaxID=7515 RepID=UPI000E6E5431|nr:zinc finger and SCAN domain-containing protein 31-like [Ctenocephalides felis]
MSEETISNPTIKIEPKEYPPVKQELDDNDITPETFLENEVIYLHQSSSEKIKQETIDDQDETSFDEGSYMENEGIYQQRFLDSEVTIDEEIKKETIDDPDESHFDEYSYTENEEICLQQFLKSEVTFEEEVKHELIDEHVADTSKNKNNVRQSSDLADNTSECNKSVKKVVGKLKTTLNLKQPLECKTCNKSFSTIITLRRHKIIHTGERPYKCETCNKAFTTNWNLGQHKKVHTEERHHKCELCNKAFKTNSNLSQHKKYHTRERLYECEICNKAFITNGALIRCIQENVLTNVKYVIKHL